MVDSLTRQTDFEEISDLNNRFSNKVIEDTKKYIPMLSRVRHKSFPDIINLINMRRELRRGNKKSNPGKSRCFQH